MDWLYPVLLFLVSYLFGSFPSAFLLTKWVFKQDIRTMGSGNVGALNVLRSTKNFFLGSVVFLLDMFKGWLPAWYFTGVLHAEFNVLIVVVFGVLFGHVHPVWLKFRGGRGLAVTAGALLAAKPILVAVWLVLWTVFFYLIRKYVVATLIATFLLPIIVFFTTDWLFSNDVLLMILPVSMLIFFRHLEGVFQLIRGTDLPSNKKESKNGN